MTGLWLSLPQTWRLENVQSGLNVVINVLSFFAAPVFVQYCWKRKARLVAKGQNIPLYSLLTINTPGEALDVLFLLKQRLFAFRYASLLGQFFIVTGFFVAAILSGPIAQCSTRLKDIIQDQSVPGYLSAIDVMNAGLDSVWWNLTYASLDRAGFPKNELLDFILDNSIDWRYDPAQWNNSWTVECESVANTPVQIDVNEQCGNGDPYEFFANNATNVMLNGFDFDDYTFTTNAGIIDSQFYMYFEKWGPFTDGYAQNLTFALIILNLHNTPFDDPNAPMNSSFANLTFAEGCNMSAGPVGRSSYTTIQCAVNIKPWAEDLDYRAAPDRNLDTVAYSYSLFYGARFYHETNARLPVTSVTPDELIRFYQTYHAAISADSTIRQIRTIKISVQVVQLSFIFLLFATVTALLTSIGFLDYIIFFLRHESTHSSTPQTRIDWMIQSIPADGLRFTNDTNSSAWTARNETCVQNKRQVFENAMCSGHNARGCVTDSSPAVISIASTSSTRPGSMNEKVLFVRPDAIPSLRQSIISEAISPVHFEV